MTAVYAGDTGFNASSSQTLTQNVRPANDAFAGRTTIAGTSATLAGSTVGAYVRWLKVERAMRLRQPLPAFSIGGWMTAAIVVVAVALAAVVVF